MSEEGKGKEGGGSSEEGGRKGTREGTRQGRRLGKMNVGR